MVRIGKIFGQKVFQIGQKLTRKDFTDVAYIQVRYLGNDGFIGTTHFKNGNIGDFRDTFPYLKDWEPYVEKIPKTAH